jgi:hypothetical protein
MSGVVLRCPNCGTTKSASGECEACHEAQVRYYCSNHTPGLWLDAPSCPHCGARFGEATRASVRPVPDVPGGARALPSRAAPRPAPRAVPGAPRRTPVPGPSEAPRPPPLSAAPPASGDSASRFRRSPPVADEESSLRDERIARGPDWDELLRSAARARRSPPETVWDREAAPPAAERRAGGCVGRFLLILALLFFALMAGLSVLSGSLLRLFL